MLEAAAAALERGAPILAEVLGQGMTHGHRGFPGAEPRPGRALPGHRLALERAAVSPGEVDLLVWAPQGYRQDIKVLEACRRVFGEQFAELPLAGSTFTTGFIESASILVGLRRDPPGAPGGNQPLAAEDRPSRTWIGGS